MTVQLHTMRIRFKWKFDPIDIRVCEFTRVTPRINFNRSLVCPKNIN